MVVNDEVFVGSSQGGLFAYGLRDGKLRWRDESLRVAGPDEHNVSQPLTGFAAADGILVAPAGASIVTYETAGPETRIDSGPGGTETDTSATFGFSSPDPEARFECRMDAGEWGACSSPTTHSDLAPGQHTFSVRAIDTGGRPDRSPATKAFTKSGPPPPDPAPDPPPGPDPLPRPPGVGPLLPSGTGPAAMTPTRDLRPPQLRQLSVRPKTIRRGRGTRVTVRLTERAVVKLAVQRRRGRRWRSVSGAERQAWLAAGRSRVRVPWARRLRAGRYRVSVVAVDPAGNKSSVETARFTVQR